MNHFFCSVLFCFIFFVKVNISCAQNFETIKVGSQVWMAKNLDIEVPGSWCYDNNPDNCKKYGRLYTYEAAIKACPKGWHLPSSEEWSVLANYLGGEDVAGKALKAGGSSGLKLPLGGNRVFSGTYGLIGTYGCYWSSTKNDAKHAWYLYVTDKNDYITLTYFTSSYGFNVRYIKD
jgi:uncharacterized protein (TIGR02145 family)